MSCPHSSVISSTPDNCSQCLLATARVVKFDRDSGKLVIGSVMQERGAAQPHISRTSVKQRTSMGRRSFTKRCGLCGKTGHNRVSCGR
jgi:hypothetical protein